MSFIYNFIIFLLAFGAIQEVSKDTAIDKNLYRIIVWIMILTAGLGYALSPDWGAYLEAFNIVGELPNLAEVALFGEFYAMEQGFLYANRFLYNLGFDFGGVSLLLVTISLLLKSNTFYKYAGYPMLALFMYTVPTYFFEEHIHIRQGIANAIALYSVKYIINRNFLKFIICIALAYQFHESVIVFVLAYWIAKVKLNTPMIGISVVIAIVANLTGLTSIIDSIMEIMPFGQDKYEAYESHIYKSSSGIAVGDIVKLMTIGAVMLYNKQAEEDELYLIFRNLFVMGVLLYFFLGKGIFGIRLPGYYTVFIGLVVCRILYNIREAGFTRNFVFYSFFSYTVILFFWFQIKQGPKTNFGNYRTFFHPTSVYGLWR